jgi:hypothetical protein
MPTDEPAQQNDPPSDLTTGQVDEKIDGVVDPEPQVT